jgi:hypothetical protein
VIDSLTGQGINVGHACRMLGVSSSGFYAWKDRPASARALRHLWLAGEITDVHRESGGIYGERRVAAELRHGRGIIVSRKTGPHQRAETTEWAASAPTMSTTVTQRFALETAKQLPGEAGARLVGGAYDADEPTRTPAEEMDSYYPLSNGMAALSAAVPRGFHGLGALLPP